MPRAPRAAINRGSMPPGNGAYSATVAERRRTAVTCESASPLPAASSWDAPSRARTASNERSLSLGTAGRLDISANRTSDRRGDQEAKGDVEAWREHNG